MSIRVEIHATRAEIGAAAARDVAEQLRRRLAEPGSATRCSRVASVSNHQSDAVECEIAAPAPA